MSIDQPLQPPRQSVQFMPVTAFASVMGLGGTALAWRRAAKVWGLPQWPFLALLALAVVAMLVVSTAYVVKWARHSSAARAELRHPIRLAFVPTITIALLVLATALQDLVPEVAGWLWWVGAIGHLAATIGVLSAWSARPDIGAGHVTPAWFIPIVGNVITPLAAAELGSVDLAWFAFGVGVTFWLALLPLLLQRILTHDQPFPQMLMPSYAIFIAPPAVILLSWQSLTGDLNSPVVRVLYAATVMFALLVAAQFKRLRAVRFGMPYWAYTFPVAAGAVAAIAVAGARGPVAYDVVAVIMLAAATVITLGVLGLTLAALAGGRLLLPEEAPAASR